MTVMFLWLTLPVDRLSEVLESVSLYHQSTWGHETYKYPDSMTSLSTACIMGCAYCAVLLRLMKFDVRKPYLAITFASKNLHC